MTTQGLTPDSQAVLLLCARLGQREENGTKPLSVKQYAALARWLRERSLRPGDLLKQEGRQSLCDLQLSEVSQEAVARLLDRGAALGLMVERWTSSGVWILSRGDAQYPACLKTYLGQQAPPLLYGVGERGLLASGGLGIVGSRDASEEDLCFTRRVAKTCVEQRLTVISGAAKGVDIESMLAAIESGGSAVGVLAEGLGRSAVRPDYHDALIEGRLALISAYEPEARWFAHTAMERNKLIYGFSAGTLVVCSAIGEGGTWSGATEALQHGRVPVYVKSTGTVAPGNHELLKLGARQFPSEPWTNLTEILTPLASEQSVPANPNQVNFVAPAVAAEADTKDLTETQKARHSIQESLDVYNSALLLILQALKEPKEEAELAEVLRVLPSQAKLWLKRAVNEGKVRKTRKPVRYVTTENLLLENA